MTTSIWNSHTVFDLNLVCGYWLNIWNYHFSLFITCIQTYQPEIPGVNRTSQWKLIWLVAHIETNLSPERVFVPKRQFTAVNRHHKRQVFKTSHVFDYWSSFWPKSATNWWVGHQIDSSPGLIVFRKLFQNLIHKHLTITIINIDMIYGTWRCYRWHKGGSRIRSKRGGEWVADITPK